MIDKDLVYTRMGMALASAQQVEFITNQLVSHLSEFDKDIYGITGEEFLAASPKANLARATLGNIFKLLKLDSSLAIEEELTEYLSNRHLLVHRFWEHYLDNTSVAQMRKAIDFCYDFGKQSEKLESFFKGFLFFLAVRHVEDSTTIDNELKKLEKDFDYFIATLPERRLRDKSSSAT